MTSTPRSPATGSDFDMRNEICPPGFRAGPKDDCVGKFHINKAGFGMLTANTLDNKWLVVRSEIVVDARQTCDKETRHSYRFMK